MRGLEPAAGEVCQGGVQVLNPERFSDQAPAEGIVAEQHAVRERRDQLSHPTYAAPEPAARGFREESTAFCPGAAKAPCAA